MDAIPINTRDGTIRTWCALDELLHVLADEERRALIAELEALETETINAGVLTDRLADRLAVEETTELDIILHHRHLPEIEATGLIEYDEQTRRIRYYDCPFVARLLSMLENEAVSRDR